MRRRCEDCRVPAGKLALVRSRRTPGRHMPLQRREFLECATLSAIALSLRGSRLADGRETAIASALPRGFLDLIRPPDAVVAQTASGERPLKRDSGGRWTSDTLVVTTDQRPAMLGVSLSAPNVAVTRLHLRWRG